MPEKTTIKIEIDRGVKEEAEAGKGRLSLCTRSVLLNSVEKSLI